jgi:large subunit ribosomal protein L29
VSTKQYKELKQLSKTELTAKQRELEANLFQAKMKGATGQLEDKATIWRLRKDLARVKSLQGAQATKSDK